MKRTIIPAIALAVLLAGCPSEDGHNQSERKPINRCDLLLQRIDDMCTREFIMHEVSPLTCMSSIQAYKFYKCEEITSDDRAAKRSLQSDQATRKNLNRANPNKNVYGDQEARRSKGHD